MLIDPSSVRRNTISVLDLFSGIGGISLGLERAGPFRTVAFCEVLESRRRTLKRHWPDTPIHEDVRTLDGRSFAASGESVDLICGGFPCQDISLAGRGEGIAGARSGLWKEFARLIGEIGPRWVVVENVAALRSPRRKLRFCECGWRGASARRVCPSCGRDLGRAAEGLVLAAGLGTVLADLAALGYNAEWHSISSADLGSPNIRDRVWVIARKAAPYTSSGGREEGKRNISPGKQNFEGRHPGPSRNASYPQVLLRPALLREQQNRAVQRYWPQTWREFLDSAECLDDGVPFGVDKPGKVEGSVDQLAALGATVCVAIPEMIGNAIMIAEGMREPPDGWDEMLEAA